MANRSSSDDNLPSRPEVIEATPIELDSRQNSDVELEVFKAQSFQGPLPPPEMLAEYERVCPGLANRIVVMAEAQGNHRRQQENKVLDADIEAMRYQAAEIKTGQWLGFVIGMSFIVAGVTVALHGSPWAGVIFSGMGISTIVTAFIWGRDKRLTPDQSVGSSKAEEVTK